MDREKKVEIAFLSEAIVVLAQSHNPSILHPSFLKAQEIVPEDWEPLEPPICTPPFSIAKYPEGIVFTSEVQKFQIVKAPPTPNLRDSKLPEYATKYVRALPHVPYRAVGINFSAGIASSDPEIMLIERFLTGGPWNSASLPLNEIHLKFVYQVEAGVLNLSCGPGKSSSSFSGAMTSGVLVQGNYHLPLADSDRAQRTEEAISTFYDRCAHFERILETIFETKE